MHLILGTAQLGINYGITNTNSKPNLSQSLSILNKAYNNKIYIFDTAQTYGDSEYKLGIFNKNKSNTTIITKIHVDNNSIRPSVLKSIANLQCKSLDVLLLHDYTYLNNKIVIEELLKLQQQNLIQNLGISVYNVNEAIDSLSKPYIKYLQIPVNFLDQQWNNKTFQDLVKQRKDVFIYVRSIFLQGILVNDIIKWPKIKNIDNQIYFNKITKLVENYQLKNKLSLCVSYIKSLNWINGVVFGVDNEMQLIENIELFKSSRMLNAKELNYIQNLFRSVPVELTNPTFWKNI